MERDVARNLESLAALVGFVREFIAAERLSEEIAFDIDLVIEELFSNLVRHARGGGGIQVQLERSPGAVRIQLRAAEASPFDPAAAPRVQVHLPLAERRAGGLGIHFVRELCKQFHYEWRDGVGTTTVVLGVTE